MIVEIVLLLAMATGAVVMYMPEVLEAGDRLRLRLVLWKKGLIDDGEEDLKKAIERGSQRELQKSKTLNQAIMRLLHITYNLRSRKCLVMFWALSLAVPLGFFFIMQGRLPAGLRAVASLCLAIAPAFLVLLRLKTLRIKSSKEGEVLLTELLDNYKINYFNMGQAVEITALTIEEAPNCRRLLFNLSKGLNRATGKEEIRRLLEDFRFAIGTSWSAVLADNMYFALSSGIKVTGAMEDLLKTVAKARQVEQQEGRENNEAGLILKYLAPVCYLLTLVAGIRYFGLTAGEFASYQFTTPAGLSWFTASVLLYAVSIGAKGFLTRRKLDL